MPFGFEALAISDLSAQDLIGSISNYLLGIHIGGGAGPRLEDIDDDNDN